MSPARASNNRGVALWKDKVISITLDGRLIAINKATGRSPGSARSRPAIAETLTAAPLIVRDIAIVGSAGGEYGIRGFIDGTTSTTGKQVWAHPHHSGGRRACNETWKGTARGGALEARRRLDWETATYDPDTTRSTRASANAGPDWESGIPAGRQTNGPRACSRFALRRKIKWASSTR